MEQMAISKFKATCLAVLERVRRTGQPVVITRFGEVVAEVVPPTRGQSKQNAWIGSMKDSVRVVGDIVSPVSSSDWEALR